MNRRELLASLGLMAPVSAPAAAAQSPQVPAVPTRDPRSSDADVGSFYPWIEKQWTSQKDLSFLNARFRNAAEWQREVRPLIFDRLFYRPPVVPFAPKVLDRVETDEYVREQLEFNTTPDIRVPAYLHIPKRVKLPAPAVVVLHDHGGYYYFGKEKVTALGAAEHADLREFKQRYYGGRSIATELARQGFVTIAIDMFYWGERRLILDEDRRRGINDWSKNESAPTIQALNSRASQYEQIVARTLFSEGITWSGIWIWDDIRTLDYLASRSEVDPARIGCAGLSFGGLRSGHLAALDPRIRAAVVVGWMTSFGPGLKKHVWNTVGLTKIIPGLYRQMDYPDLVAMTTPRPLMVIHGARDGLFAPEGVRDAVRTLTRSYEKTSARDRFRFIEFDGPHEFNVPMQEQAFAWLKKWL